MAPHFTTIEVAELEQDYAMAATMEPATGEKSQSVFRVPKSMKDCTGNATYVEDGVLKYEECSTVCSDISVKQNADFTQVRN